MQGPRTPLRRRPRGQSTERGRQSSSFCTVKLSVIVPTHDRPAELRRCLETLQAQTIAPAQLEVLVVDDGSTQDIVAVVDGVARTGPVEMRCEQQPMAGLNSARNRGVDASTGELLAFLDDDTLVASGWARALVDTFASLPAAAVGGRIELGLSAVAPPWLHEVDHYLAAYELGPSGRWLDAADPVPVGANCAVRRSEHQRLGGFRPGLDRIGTSLVSNGDTEFFRRLRDGGGRLRYEPQASVVHCVPPQRLTREFFERRHRAQGISDELLLRLQGHEPSLGHRVGLSREVLGATLAYGADVARRRDPVLNRFAISYWAGRLAAIGPGIGRDRVMRVPGEDPASPLIAPSSNRPETGPLV